MIVVGLSKSFVVYAIEYDSMSFDLYLVGYVSFDWHVELFQNSPISVEGRILS